jgi:hypothetical protein
MVSPERQIWKCLGVRKEEIFLVLLWKWKDWSLGSLRLLAKKQGNA